MGRPKGHDARACILSLQQFIEEAAEMSRYIAHEEVYRDHTIKIFPDDTCGEGPREWDNLGTMVCWHRRYNLGDKHQYADPDDFKERLAKEVDNSAEERMDYWTNGKGWQRIVKKHLNRTYPLAQKDMRDFEIVDKMVDTIIQRAISKNVIMLPLYLYDHSGITMRTSPFSCPWDSGQVGFIYVTREKILKEYSVKRISKKMRNKVVELLKGEVKMYDQFITGDVYGYEVEKDDEFIDSCWGYYGLSDCIAAAKSIVDSQFKEAA